MYNWDILLDGGVRRIITGSLLTCRYHPLGTMNMHHNIQYGRLSRVRCILDQRGEWTQKLSQR